MYLQINCDALNVKLNEMSKKMKTEKPAIIKIKNLRNEEWKTVRGYGVMRKYSVSNKGRVKSISRKTGSEKLLVQEKTIGHYLRVNLPVRKTGKIKHERTHRLVGKAFIKNTGRKPQINHKNGNGRDNGVKNLEWVTAKENVAHAIKKGLNKFTKQPVSRIARNGKVRNFPSLSEAARECKTNTMSIKAVLDGSHKTAGGYKWKM